jgi:hypothetical protein
VPSGFRSNYLLAKKSAGDGAAAMVELISWWFRKNEERSVERERVDGLLIRVTHRLLACWCLIHWWVITTNGKKVLKSYLSRLMTLDHLSW